MAKSKKVSIKERIGLLLAIRESCPNPSQDFIYCDTDSIHVFTDTYAAPTTQFPATNLENMNYYYKENENNGKI